MKRTLALFAATTALAVAGPTAAATNLIVNGDFNIPGTTPGGYRTINAGQEPGGFGWSVTGSVDVFDTDSPYGGDPDPVGGDPFGLDLVGTGNVGGIAQGFATEVGKRYVLSFTYANNPFIGGAGMRFGVKGASGDTFAFDLTHTGSTQTAMNWQEYTYEFVATDTFSTLYFNNTAGSTNGGMYLDKIGVSQVPTGVPEPATWALMIGGFGLAGASLRRRPQAAVA
ncbi:MAG: PEPxxWA-CTERM sorting domain-containing protein [Pseudomonadota bacterium]